MPIRSMDTRFSNGWRVVLTSNSTGGLLRLMGLDPDESYEYPLTTFTKDLITSGAFVPSMYQDDHGKPIVFFMNRSPKRPSLVWICDRIQMGWVPDAPWKA